MAARIQAFFQGNISLFWVVDLIDIYSVKRMTYILWKVLERILLNGMITVIWMGVYKGKYSALYTFLHKSYYDTQKALLRPREIYIRRIHYAESPRGC